MPNITTRFLISCAVLIIVACLCLSFLAIGGLALGIYETYKVPAPAATFTPAPPTAQPTPGAYLNTPTDIYLTPVPTDEVTPTPTRASSALSEDVAAKMAEIEDQVVEIRGLTPKGDVPQILMTSAELSEMVKNDFFEDYTQADAADDTIELHAFGLLPADFDLLSLYVDLYSESILGFYDQDVDEMYILQNGNFRGTERMTYAHEYTHALQDQTFDLVHGLGYDDEQCDGESERCAGIQALIEGDATLVEYTWFYDYSSEQDKSDVQQDSTNYSMPVFDSAPAYIQQDSYFAYNQGFEFVSTLYSQGGWDAVNAAYANPPVSTEQILHPDQYPNDQPIEVILPDIAGALGEEWRLIDEETMGEWYTYLMLAYADDENARLSEDDARDAAAGWGGDHYAVFTRDSDGAVVLALLTEWDNANDARDFFSAFSDYGDGRWGSPADQENSRVEWQTAGETSILTRQGKQTLWLLAPDAETGASLEPLFGAN